MWKSLFGTAEFFNSFIENYFAQKALHVPFSRSSGDWPDVSWKDVNEAISRLELPHPHVTVWKAGGRFKPTRKNIHELLFMGGNLILRQAEQHIPQLGAFLARLGEEIGERIDCNLYSAHPHSRTSDRHFDVEDVLIFQFEGSKQWRIYPPSIPYPLFEHQSRLMDPPSDDQLYFEGEIRAGDLLYVPKGHWHEVVSTDKPSLHATVSVWFRNSMGLVEILKEIFEDNEIVRKPIYDPSKQACQTALDGLIVQLRKLASDDEAWTSSMNIYNSRRGLLQDKVNLPEPYCTPVSPVSPGLYRFTNNSIFVGAENGKIVIRTENTVYESASVEILEVLEIMRSSATFSAQSLCLGRSKESGSVIVALMNDFRRLGLIIPV